MRIGIVNSGSAGLTPRESHPLRFAGRRFLDALANQVSILQTYDGNPYDLLVALHARKSHSAIINFRQPAPWNSDHRHPHRTDLYRDIRINHWQKNRWL